MCSREGVWWERSAPQLLSCCVVDAQKDSSPRLTRKIGFVIQVFHRYVSTASTWHSRLVRYFQAQAPSPRRCEELPWHLNKCYRWHPLKNTLVDLRTFEVNDIWWPPDFCSASVTTPDGYPRSCGFEWRNVSYACPRSCMTLVLCSNKNQTYGRRCGRRLSSGANSWTTGNF